MGSSASTSSPHGVRSRSSTAWIESPLLVYADPDRDIARLNLDRDRPDPRVVKREAALQELEKITTSSSSHSSEDTAFWIHLASTMMLAKKIYCQLGRHKVGLLDCAKAAVVYSDEKSATAWICLGDTLRFLMKAHDIRDVNKMRTLVNGELFGDWNCYHRARLLEQSNWRACGSLAQLVGRSHMTGVRESHSNEKLQLHQAGLSLHRHNYGLLKSLAELLKDDEYLPITALSEGKVYEYDRLYALAEAVQLDTEDGESWFRLYKFLKKAHVYKEHLAKIISAKINLPENISQQIHENENQCLVPSRAKAPNEELCVRIGDELYSLHRLRLHCLCCLRPPEEMNELWQDFSEYLLHKIDDTKGCLEIYSLTRLEFIDRIVEANKDFGMHPLLPNVDFCTLSFLESSRECLLRNSASWKLWALFAFIWFFYELGESKKCTPSEEPPTPDDEEPIEYEEDQIILKEDYEEARVNPSKKSVKFEKTTPQDVQPEEEIDPGNAAVRRFRQKCNVFPLRHFPVLEINQMDVGDCLVSLITLTKGNFAHAWMALADVFKYMKKPNALIVTKHFGPLDRLSCYRLVLKNVAPPEGPKLAWRGFALYCHDQICKRESEGNDPLQLDVFDPIGDGAQFYTPEQCIQKALEYNDGMAELWEELGDISVTGAVEEDLTHQLQQTAVCASYVNQAKSDTLFTEEQQNGDRRSKLRRKGQLCYEKAIAKDPTYSDLPYVQLANLMNVASPDAMNSRQQIEALKTAIVLSQMDCNGTVQQPQLDLVGGSSGKHRLVASQRYDVWRDLGILLQLEPVLYSPTQLLAIQQKEQSNNGQAAVSTSSRTTRSDEQSSTSLQDENQLNEIRNASDAPLQKVEELALLQRTGLPSDSKMLSSSKDCFLRSLELHAGVNNYLSWAGLIQHCMPLSKVDHQEKPEGQFQPIDLDKENVEGTYVTVCGKRYTAMMCAAEAIKIWPPVCQETPLSTVRVTSKKHHQDASCNPGGIFSLGEATAISQKYSLYYLVYSWLHLGFLLQPDEEVRFVFETVGKTRAFAKSVEFCFAFGERDEVLQKSGIISYCWYFFAMNIGIQQTVELQLFSATDLDAEADRLQAGKRTKIRSLQRKPPTKISQDRRKHVVSVTKIQAAAEAMYSDPTNMFFWSYVGVCLSQTYDEFVDSIEFNGKPFTSLECCQRALALLKTKLSSRLYARCAICMRSKDCLRLPNGDYVTAVDLLLLAKKHNSRCPELWQAASFLIGCGVILNPEHSLRMPSLLPCVKEGLRLYWPDPILWLILATALSSDPVGVVNIVTDNGIDDDDGIIDYRGAILRCLWYDPSISAAWAMLAQTMRKTERISVRGTVFTRAQCCAEAVRREPRRADIWYILARSIEDQFCKVSVGAERFSQLECFKRCVEADENFAPGWAGLSVSLGFQKGRTILVKLSDAETKVFSGKSAAIKALEIDSSVALPWVTLGLQMNPIEKQPLQPVIPHSLKQYVSKRDCFVNALGAVTLEHDVSESLIWYALGMQLDDSLENDDASESTTIMYEGMPYDKIRCLVSAADCVDGISDAWFQLAILRSEVQLRNGQIISRKNCLIRCVEMDPVHNLAWFLLSTMGDGFIGIVRGEQKTALDCVLHCLYLQNELAQGWSRLSNFLEEREIVQLFHRHYTKKDCLLRSLELDPTKTNVEGWVGLAKVMHPGESCFIGNYFWTVDLVRSEALKVLTNKDSKLVGASTQSKLEKRSWEDPRVDEESWEQLDALPSPRATYQSPAWGSLPKYPLRSLPLDLLVQNAEERMRREDAEWQQEEFGPPQKKVVRPVKEVDRLDAMIAKLEENAIVEKSELAAVARNGASFRSAARQTFQQTLMEKLLAETPDRNLRKQKRRGLWYEESFKEQSNKA